MNKGIFIVGTDTEVGKTIVSAGLIRVLRKYGKDTKALKPIATGCEQRDGGLYSEDAALLAAAAEIKDDREVTPIRYSLPLSPHVAATLEGSAIDVKALLKMCASYIKNNEFTVVEGIGGLLVPITRDYFVSDLIADLGLPVIVVGRVNLGAINHTLLTVEALKKRSLTIKGIIFNTLQERETTTVEKTNPAVIRELTHVPMLGVLPYIRDIDIARCEFGSLAKAFEENIQIDGLL
ncbi:MAG: dethiobiotin synthase [Candidatus Omnitrophica bacterium]|nr:dethiobiotin synthase [Candidatus Omnitrophota bacterium]